MDEDIGDDSGVEPLMDIPYTGKWAATSTYDAYMVNTPKDKSKEKPNKNPKRHRSKKRSKGHNGRRSMTSTLEAVDDSASPKANENLREDNQASLAQHNGPAETPEDVNLDDTGTHNDR